MLNNEDIPLSGDDFVEKFELLEADSNSIKESVRKTYGALKEWKKFEKYEQRASDIGG